jgi:carbamoyl-phosphate synthase large subunit
MKKISNVLVTGVGGIIGQGIIKCLNMANHSRKSKVKYHIIGADSSPLAAGLYFSDVGILVPNANDQGYIDFIIEVILEYKISALYVGTDQELDVLGNSSSKIERRTGAKVMICSNEVIKISRDKWKTFLFLKKKGLPCMESSLPVKAYDFSERFGFPVVVKPRGGYGSIYFTVVRDRDELDTTIDKLESNGWKAIIQEYVPGIGNEYTTGVLSDNKSNKIISSISIKKYLKCGQTYKGIIDDFREARFLSENVAKNLNAKGSINVQTKVSKGSHKIFEINGRLSATCPMRAYAGINEPDLLYRNVIFSENPRITSYKKLVCMRYWNEVYIQERAYEKVGSSGLVPESLKRHVFAV